MSKVTDYVNNEAVISFTSETAFTLPSYNTRNSLTLKNLSTPGLTLTAAGSELIDGGATYVVGGNSTAKLVRGEAGWVVAEGSDATAGTTLYVSGNLGVGAASVPTVRVYTSGNSSGDTTTYGFLNEEALTASVSVLHSCFNTNPSQNAGTLSELRHFAANQNTLSGTVTTQMGFIATSTLTGATNNYGFRGAIAAGSGRYNLYMDGTAANLLAGDLTLSKLVITTPTALTYAAPTSVDVTLGSCFTVTTVNATGSVTVNATAGGTAGQEMTILVTNDATSAKTLTFGTNFKSTGTLTAGAASRQTTITFKSDGTNFLETGRAVLST